MKRFLVFLLLLPLIDSVAGQGLVYFDRLDSLQFEINKENEEEIRVVDNKDSSKIVKYPKLPKSVIQENRINAMLLYKPDKLKFRLGVDGGFSYRIAPISQDLPEELYKYKKDLRSGKYIGTDFTYLLSPMIGIGVKYSLFSTDHNSDKQKIDDRVIFRSDNLNIHYVGPFFTIRSIVKKNKMYANFDFSVGYTVYVNSITYDNKSDLITEENFGFSSSIGTDFMVSNNLSLGWNFTVSAASFADTNRSEKIKLVDKENENLSRIGFGLRVRYYSNFRKR